MGMELAEIDAPPELKERIHAVVAWSESNVIASAEDYQATAGHLKDIKRSQKLADEFFDEDIKRAHELHKSLCGKKTVLTAPLKQAEQIDKSKMLAFERAEREKAEAERRRLQAIADEQARKEREKAEQAAAKQRAIEAEQRAKAEQARREAEAANEKERRRLLAEAEAAERKAAAAVAKQEQAEEKAAAVVAPVVAVASAAPKLSGVSTRKAWKAEIVDLDAFLAFCCQAARTDLLLPNMKSIEGMAKALKERASLPGVQFFETEIMSASSR